MRAAADNVTSGVVPNSGHWIMEENPQATVKLGSVSLGVSGAAASVTVTDSPTVLTGPGCPACPAVRTVPARVPTAASLSPLIS